jgi:hypothetical protein
VEQQKNIWKMMVMTLSALDSIKATVDANAIDASKEYNTVKSSANQALSQSFIDGVFDTVRPEVIFSTVLGAQALSKGPEEIFM